MSDYILPLIVLFIVVYGIRKKVDLYDAFIEGSKDSFKMSLTIFPNLLAMILSVNILVNSGILEDLIKSLNYINRIIHNFLQIVVLRNWLKRMLDISQVCLLLYV